MGDWYVFYYIKKIILRFWQVNTWCDLSKHCCLICSCPTSYSIGLPRDANVDVWLNDYLWRYSNTDLFYIFKYSYYCQKFGLPNHFSSPSVPIPARNNGRTLLINSTSSWRVQSFLCDTILIYDLQVNVVKRFFDSQVKFFLILFTWSRLKVFDPIQTDGWKSIHGFEWIAIMGRRDYRCILNIRKLCLCLLN